MGFRLDRKSSGELTGSERGRGQKEKVDRESLNSDQTIAQGARAMTVRLSGQTPVSLHTLWISCMEMSNVNILCSTEEIQFELHKGE